MWTFPTCILWSLPEKSGAYPQEMWCEQGTLHAVRPCLSPSLTCERQQPKIWTFFCKLQIWSFNNLICSSIKPPNKDPHDSIKKHKDLPYDTTAPYQQEIIVAFPLKSAVSLHFLKHHCIISKKTCSFVGKASFWDVSCDHCIILCKLWMSLQKLPTI